MIIIINVTVVDTLGQDNGLL